MKMYLVLSQVEHQTIECHRKNINIVYLFGLSVVSLSYYYKPGRPPLPASLACPGRPPLADLSPGLPYLPGSSPLADLPWHTSPHTSPLQTSPGRPLPGRPPLSLTHLPGWARKNKKWWVSRVFFIFLSIFYHFSSFFDSFYSFSSVSLENDKKMINNW